QIKSHTETQSVKPVEMSHLRPRDLPDQTVIISLIMVRASQYASSSRNAGNVETVLTSPWTGLICHSVSSWTGQPVSLFLKGDQILALNDLHIDNIQDYTMLINKSLKNEIKLTILRLPVNERAQANSPAGKECLHLKKWILPSTTLEHTIFSMTKHTFNVNTVPQGVGFCLAKCQVKAGYFKPVSFPRN
uniref:PDZ domain-containing protein n=1 Tax=Neogobius melanostomus TaxID=47308 RepID=A0A8C6WQU8_9GOBI